MLPDRRAESSYTDGVDGQHAGARSTAPNTRRAAVVRVADRRAAGP